MRVLFVVMSACEALVAGMSGLLLFADVVSIDVGPTLGLLISTLITSIFGAVTAWMAYKRADQAVIRVEDKAQVQDKALTEIHTAVNSSTEKMASRLESAEKQLLEVSKLLAASQERAQVMQAKPVTQDVVVVNDPDAPIPTKDTP